MKNIIPPSTSLLEHKEGGSEKSSKVDLRQRADEIAEIRGHSTADGDDRAQARQELNGDSLPAATDEDSSSANSLSRDPSDPFAQHGRRVSDHEDSSEETDLEKLVTEGVEEAQHDQMLAARKRNLS